MIIDDYLEFMGTVRRCAPATLRIRGGYIHRLADDHDLLTVTTAQLRLWIAKDRDWKPNTVNAATAALRSFYRWAHEVGHIDRDPAAPLRGVRVPARKARIATGDQIAAGLASKRLEIRAFTLLGAECGLRVHEIAKLRVDERDGDWLTIIGKGAQERSVTLSPELGGILDALVAEHPGSPWYFPSPAGEGHVTTETLRVWSARHLGTNPHSLRHRAGTTVYRGTGNNLRVTQVFLGHRYPATTAIYVHVEREDLLQAGAAARLAA